MKNIKCPHCGYEFTEVDFENSPVDLYGLCIGEYNDEISCPDCYKNFWVSGSYILTYKTFKTEEEMDNS